MADEYDRSQLRPTPLQFEQLTKSYRFDGELARLLTEFQYQADGISLTAAGSRSLPTKVIDAPTAGVDAVFDSESSLVFVCYDNREYQMVNPVETLLITAITQAINADGSVAQIDGPLGEESDTDSITDQAVESTEPSNSSQLSIGVVTPHNAQRGQLKAELPDQFTANTVEKYQGDERDIIAVSATVTDPEFARREKQFILNPRRLLVAISRSRLLTIVVCSTALFEVAPEDSDRLDHGPVWARLFTEAVGRNHRPTWAGPLAEFVGDNETDHANVPVQVYPSALDGGDQS